jgi:uncharacterized delta-60 repeat protein
MQKLFWAILSCILLQGCGAGLCPIRNITQVCISAASGGGGGSLWVSPLGFLDTTYGTSVGYTLTNISANTNYGNGILLQGNKAIVGGTAIVAGNGRFSLSRYHANGSLDTTFGVAGITTTNATGSGDYIYAMVSQPDGKIVTVGNEDGTDAILVARYSADGILDSSFATLGIATSTITAGVFSWPKIALQSTGNIIVSGDSGSDFGVARYTPSGVLDTTFGSAGITTINFYGGADMSGGLKVLSDNSIIVGGTATNGGVNFALAKLYANGVLDTTFGTGGKADVNLPTLTNESVKDIAIQSNGKIIVVGYGDNGMWAPTLVRFTANGILDSTFGASGISIVNFNSGGPYSAEVQPDDKIVIAGYSNSSDPTIARFTATGALDSTFGIGGIVSMVLANTYYRSVAISATGEIYAGGIGWNGANQDSIVAKYR